MVYSTLYQTPVGLVTLACDEAGSHLVGLWIESQKYHGAAFVGAMSEKGDLPLFAMVGQWLDSYFAGGKPKISELPLAPIGTAFRQGVWQILKEIPYGKVITYGDIAKEMAIKMGKESMSAQAVGGAVGHNPISIIIPCHRVVGTSGSLTGFAGGISVKKKLLELEGVDMSSMFVPKKGTAL